MGSDVQRLGILAVGNVLMCMISGITTYTQSKSISLMSRTWTTTDSTANKFRDIHNLYLTVKNVSTNELDVLKASVLLHAGCGTSINSVMPSRWSAFNQSPLCNCLSVQHELYKSSVHQPGNPWNHTINAVYAKVLSDQCLWKVRGTQVSYMQDSTVANTVNPLALFQLWCTLASVCSIALWCMQLMLKNTAWDVVLINLFVFAAVILLVFCGSIYLVTSIPVTIAALLITVCYACWVCGILIVQIKFTTWRITSCLVFWPFFAAAMAIIGLLYNYYAHNQCWIYNVAFVTLSMGIALIMYSCDMVSRTINENVMQPQKNVLGKNDVTDEAYRESLINSHNTTWMYTMAMLLAVYSCCSMSLDATAAPLTASALSIVIPLWGLIFIMDNQAIREKTADSADYYRLLIDFVARGLILVSLILDVISHNVVDNQ